METQITRELLKEIVAELRAIKEELAKGAVRENARASEARNSTYRVTIKKYIDEKHD